MRLPIRGMVYSNIICPSKTEITLASKFQFLYSKYSFVSHQQKTGHSLLFRQIYCNYLDLGNFECHFNNMIVLPLCIPHLKLVI